MCASTKSEGVALEGEVVPASGRPSAYPIRQFLRPVAIDSGQEVTFAFSLDGESDPALIIEGEVVP